jgi:hypothetical protein
MNDELPGGSTPSQYGLPPNSTELQDLIEHREMNFAVGNIFKAAYRLGRCSHSDQARDLRKIIWFAERELTRVENLASEDDILRQRTGEAEIARQARGVEEWTARVEEWAARVERQTAEAKLCAAAEAAASVVEGLNATVNLQPEPPEPEAAIAKAPQDIRTGVDPSAAPAPGQVDPNDAPEGYTAVPRPSVEGWSCGVCALNGTDLCRDTPCGNVPPTRSGPAVYFVRKESK